MIRKQTIFGLFLVLGLLVISTFGWAAAQEPEPPREQPDAVMSIDAMVGSSFTYQGVLKEDDAPVTGTRDMIFRLYSNSSCTTQVGSNIPQPGVQVANGFFTVNIPVYQGHFTGRALWLQVEVGGTAIGCQAITAVPYALSLRPGADITGEQEDWDAIHAENKATSGHSYGVYGKSSAPAGAGGFFTNNAGPAIKAAGTGIIQSRANSYLWISGNNLVKSHHDDTTEFVRDLYGGYKIYSGTSGASAEYVILPITIFGQMYGQNVTISGLDLYYTVSADLTGISRTFMRRQNGVNSGQVILQSSEGLTCSPGGQCQKHWDLTENNILSDQQGILYLSLQLSFPSNTAFVQIGGVRLTLEHD